MLLYVQWRREHRPTEQCSWIKNLNLLNHPGQELGRERIHRWLESLALGR